jgi:predicted deacetylase
VAESHLVVSLSGLTHDAPEALDRAIAFTGVLDARGVPLSQLFRPAGVPDGSPLARWMRERRAAGDALVLHGFDHTADPIGAWQSSALPRMGRRAEFATLPRHEAGLRLVAARRALTVLGLRTDLFVPPRWLASPGTVEALREQGFGVLADEHGVRFLRAPGEPLLRSRVLGFRVSGERRPVADDRPAAEAWRCRVLAAEVTRTVRRGGLVRINVRAKDLKRPPRLAAVLAAVDAALALGATPTTYQLTAAARAA